jgi:phage gp29-like protein
MLAVFAKAKTSLGLLLPRFLKTDTPKQTRKLIASRTLDKYISHPGYGVDPRTIVSIYRNAEQGYTASQCDLFEDILESDGHLRSVIESRTLALTGKTWQIQADGTEPASLKAAEILQQALSNANFSSVIQSIISCRYFGYSASEIIWGQNESGDFIPKHFIPIPHRRISFDDYDVPKLLNKDLVYNDGEDMPLGEFIFSANSGIMSETITARSGLLRTATWFALFKRWSWRDWTIYANKFGIPAVIGKYEPEAEPESIAELEKAVKDIGEAGQAVLPSNTNIEMKEPASGGNSNIHAAIVASANAEISKLIAGATLTSEIKGNGSYAAASVHENVAFSLVKADYKLVADAVKDQIIIPFLKYNGFSNIKPPRLVIHISKTEAGTERLAQFEKALSMNIELDKEQIREELQFRAPPSAERTLKAGPLSVNERQNSGGTQTQQ